MTFNLTRSKFLIALTSVVLFATGCSTKSSIDDAGPVTDPTDLQNQIVTDDSANQPVVEETDPRDAVIGVDTVFYFDFDQSILKSEARTALLIHAKVIKELNANVRLEGHADERGSREYNMALGERRANAARDFLVLQGVPSYLIETVSYGEERPAEVGGGDSVWSKNRRVEIQY